MKFVRLRIAATSIAAVFALGLALVPSGRGQDKPSQGRGSITPAQAREEVDKVVQDLREARTIASKVGERATRERLELILGQAELRARNLSDDLARAKPAQAPQVILTAADVDKIAGALKKEPFDPGKLAYLENFGSGNPLTCQQAATFLKCFTFDELRIKAATVLYPKLLDRQNFNDVLNTFTFETNKATVRKAVGLK